jgi:hypothetical protein
MFLPLAFAALVPAAAAGASAAEVRPCPGFASGRANPVEVHRFYVRRVISIVNAAAAEDLAALDALVSPEASLEIWRGDYSVGGREPGRAVAIEMVRILRPVRYQSQIGQPGPISVLSTICTHEVTLLFRTEEPTVGFSMTFNFRDGVMVSATGSEVALFEGGLP